MKRGQQDQGLNRMDMQDDTVHIQDGLAKSLGPSQSSQYLLPPQAFAQTPAANPSNQLQPSNRNVGQRPARRNQDSQKSASCTLCRRRKVKCDRGVPCSNCARGGAECVPSILSQAPRGRQGGRKRRTDRELLERIAKLEGLVKNVEGNSDEYETNPRRMNSMPPVHGKEGSLQDVVSDAYDQSNGSSNGATGIRNQTSGSGLDRYLGTSFWVTLSEEINGLKDVLNDSSDEEDEAEDGKSSALSPEQQQLQQTSDSGFVLSSTNPVQSPDMPSPLQLYTFCEIYLTNVDPVLKILHAPSLRKYLQEGAGELDCSPGPRGLEALKFAICYAATLSMSDGECSHRIGENRGILMAKYRAGTELALAKADFVNTVEMSTLQAMTIYLVITCFQHTSRCYSSTILADKN